MTSTPSDLALAVDRALGEILPVSALLDMAATDAPLDPSRHEQILRLGWLGINLPEAQGGLGLEPAAIAELSAVAGRRLLPAPLREEGLLLAPMLAEAARRGDPAAVEWLTGLLDGSVRGGGAVLRDSCIPPRPEPGDAGGLVVRWSEVPVWLGPKAQVAYVLADDWGLVLDLGDPRIRLRSSGAIDPAQGLTRVSVDGVPIPATRCFAGEASRRWSRLWQLAVLAQVVGCAEYALELAVEHAKRREQFGQTLATFQAIAHMLADMKAAVEVSRSGVARLVATLSAPAPDNALDDILAALRYTVPDMARFVCERAIQVHGGMGFTWEYGLHLYYRRVLQCQAALGGAKGAAIEVGRRYRDARRRGPRRMTA